MLPVNLLAARAAERFGAPAIIAAGAAIAAVGCGALIGIDRGTNYWAICAQLVAIGAGLGLLVPPLTSTLLGSVEKERSGVAAGVLNSTRQTGSVLGVALFGSLIGQANAFITGARESLIISAMLLLGAAVTIMAGGHSKKSHSNIRKTNFRGSDDFRFWTATGYWSPREHLVLRYTPGLPERFPPGRRAEPAASARELEAALTRTP